MRRWVVLAPRRDVTLGIFVGYIWCKTASSGKRSSVDGGPEARWTRKAAFARDLKKFAARRREHNGERASPDRDGTS